MTKIARNSLFVTVLVVVSMAGQAAFADWWPLRGNGERGSGNLVTEEREVDDFTKIENSGSADILVTVGEEKKVTVRIDDNLIDFIVTEVRRGTLEIYSEGSYSSRHGCTIEISIPSLEAVSASGSGDIEIGKLEAESFNYRQSGSGDFRADGNVGELEIKVSGSGDADASELTADHVFVTVRGSGDVRVHAERNLEARTSGSGDIMVVGEVEEAEIETSGSGDIDARRLTASSAYVRTRGSGDVRVRVTGDLDGVTSGSGDIYYYGDPEHVSRRSSGSGEVLRKR
jgi:hypothetical protein